MSDGKEISYVSIQDLPQGMCILFYSRFTVNKEDSGDMKVYNGCPATSQGQMLLNNAARS